MSRRGVGAVGFGLPPRRCSRHVTRRGPRFDAVERWAMALGAVLGVGVALGVWWLMVLRGVVVL